MTFVYLFIDAAFDIFNTLLFQYFWSALFVAVAIPLGFAFISWLVPRDRSGDD